MMRMHGATLRAAWRPLFATAVIAAGLVARAAAPGAGYDRGIWYAGLIIAGSLVVSRTLQGALRGHFAADVVATLAIVASALLGQPFVGLVIVIMQTGGEALERYAEGRASDAVRALEAVAPRIAHRLRDERVIEDVPVDAVAPDDVLLVRPGELVPCDGMVVDGSAHVDVSMLTGEPLPIFASHGTKLMSGSANLDGALTVLALAPARESQYARIVALVRSAQASKAPLQSIADRYAVWFTPATLAVCVIAYLTSGDWLRVLAVLAVATPCPLILATPVAVIGGINRAARRHIIMRHGTALERLGTATIAVFDKTGTITIGQPRVRHVIQANGRPPMAVLRMAGAVERSSGHLLARTLVEAAEATGLTLPAAVVSSSRPGGASRARSTATASSSARGRSCSTRRRSTKRGSAYSSRRMPVFARTSRSMVRSPVSSSTRTRSGRESPTSFAISPAWAFDASCCCPAIMQPTRAPSLRRWVSLTSRAISCPRARFASFGSWCAVASRC